MTLHLWLVYLGVIAVLIAVPGPSALLSMAHGLRYGQRRALATILGGASGSLVLMTASALGLGAILAASATAFLALKVVGALYLIWLGISAWRTRESTLTPSAEVDEAAPGALGLYRHGFMVGVSNPKDILFFAALFPNFIDTSAPQAMQFALLALTWVVLDFSIMFTYACMGHRVSALFAHPRRLRLFNRATGTLFIFAGSALVASTK
ncbi:LysE family translocator [Dickeya fangzhongdai]|uniref:LysE family translocator n=1 Tax=Dickeya fangzhongdai TaxID=1778540 RepID=UPI0004F83297|nr:LysE family transporter [Dickeya fangzhongdai]AIR69660.1 amino acid transporter [Dickeya fangzhongdai]KGT96892.1 amino acid transporter [Dickeya fangzhongdai]